MEVAVALIIFAVLILAWFALPGALTTEEVTAAPVTTSAENMAAAPIQ